jgi:spermidine/putrescine transport system substrate-binding protein
MPIASPSSAPATFPTSASGELHLYNWTDYIDAPSLEQFTKETGIKVILDVYDSNETMLAKMQSGNSGYDVIFPSDYMVTAMRELNLLQPIDLKSFPNYQNIKPEWQHVAWDQDREYSAPYMYGTTAIICVPSKVDCASVKSWHDFFTTTESTVGVVKDQIEVVSAALRAVGVAGTDLCTTDRSKYQAAADLLKNFNPRNIDSDSIPERVMKGETNLVLSWNGEAHRVRGSIPDVQYIYPTDGANRWADNMAIPVGAANRDAAMVFINWMMQPQVAAAQSNYTGYDNSIAGSSSFMDSSLTSDPAVVTPADVVSRLSQTPDCPQDVRDLYTQVFTTFLAQ